MSTKKKPVTKKAGTVSPIDYGARWPVYVGAGIIFFGLLVFFRKFIFSDSLMIIGSDFYQAGFVVKSFLKEHIGLGDVKAHWNPYIFGGIPYIEAFYSDIFYPLSILFREGENLWRMLSYNLVLHFFLAAWFMYLCARQFGLGQMPSLFAAASYSFAPYFMSLLAPYHDGKIFVTTFFPLMFYFLERGFQSATFFRQFLNFSLFGGAIGFAALAPHIQMTYFSLLALFFFTIFRLVNLWRDKRTLRPIAISGSLAAWGVAIGLGLSAIQLYPGVVYTQSFSPRADTKKGWDWATSWSMHEEEAMSLFIPEFAGASTEKAKTYYWGKNAFKDNSESPGTVAFALALIAVCFVRRRDSFFFIGLGLFALFYALGATTPVFRLFFALIPKIESLRAPSMIMFVFSFAIAMLAAMGLQYWIDRRGELAVVSSKKFRNVLGGVVGLFFLMALILSVGGRGFVDLWTSIFFDTIASVQIQPGVTKLDLAYANLPSITSGAWLAFLLVGIATLMVWLFAQGKVGLVALTVLIALPVVDGIRFNKRFLDVIDPAPLISVSPAVAALQSLPGNFRALDLSSPRGPQDGTLPQNRIAIPSGYHGNQLRWYDDLLGGIGMPKISEPRVLNLAGVKYIILPTGQNFPQEYFGSKPLQMIQTLGQQQLYRNDNALPKVFLASQYEVFPERAQIYPRILNGTDSLENVVFLEEAPSFPSHLRAQTDSTWIISYGMDSIRIGVQASSASLLVLTDNWFDGWRATVSNQPTEIFRAYGTFRAVEVSPGKSEILFSYYSPRYATGKLFTLLTSVYLLLAVLAFGIVAFRDRRNQGLGQS